MLLVYTIDQKPHYVSAHFGCMNRHGGEHGLNEAGVFHIVDAYNGHGCGHRDALFLEQLHDTESGNVIGTDDGRAVQAALQSAAQILKLYDELLTKATTEVGRM